MFIPLVDSLRCPNAHEETWFVASIDHAENRDIREGFLGCPICNAEYPIRDGVVYFDENVQRPPGGLPNESDAMRLAAALDLTEPRATAILQGAWATHAPLIVGMSPAELLLVNPPAGITSGDQLSIVVARSAPVARGAIAAAAFDADADAALRTSIRLSIKGGGRLLGPASVAVPDDFTRLAGDDDVWVAQAAVGTTSAPILPQRRPRTDGR